MTEQAVEEQEEQEFQGPLVFTVADVNTEPDVILRELVAAVNAEKDAQTGVTLYVSGIIVSGMLISYEAYWETLLARVRENSVETVRTKLTSLGEQIAAFDSEDRDNDQTPPNYVHLRDAIVFAPGVSPTLPRTFWRGRLSQVSAWSLGIFAG